MNKNVDLGKVIHISRSASNQTPPSSSSFNSSSTAKRVDSPSYQKSLERLRQKSDKFDW